MLTTYNKSLPHCDTLFEKFFAPWYPEKERPTMTRPDMFRVSSYEGKPLDLKRMQYLPPEELERIKTHILTTMTSAVLKDFQYGDNSKTIDLDLLAAVDHHYDRQKILDLIQASDPTDFSNPYLVTTCEFGVILGHLFRQNDGFDWFYSRPYFDSIIVDRDTGFGIPVFDWAVKKFSEYGVDDGFTAKFLTAVDVIKKYRAGEPV